MDKDKLVEQVLQDFEMTGMIVISMFLLMFFGLSQTIARQRDLGFKKRKLERQKTLEKTITQAMDQSQEPIYKRFCKDDVELGLAGGLLIQVGKNMHIKKI